ncbi:Transketolase [Drechslerella dactyloides]|uniref:Transketolase n=1 Tax=Drechslerella dactyloides TaxID=74499 RepID=A0AAD6IUT7_DREDA|nr:Transketolase [Drechslerella dactyloides]
MDRTHEQSGLNGFCASGFYKDIYKFTPEGTAKRAKATIKFWKGVEQIRSPLNRAFTQLI